MLKDFTEGVLLTLGDNWEAYGAVLIFITLGALGLFVLGSLLMTIWSHSSTWFSKVKPAFRLALAKLGEKRMRERNRTEELKILVSDEITDGMDRLLLAGKISKKERHKVWNALGRAMQLPDLLVSRKKHPEAIKANIRRNKIDKTPVALPDMKHTPTAKWNKLQAMRKTA